MARWQCNAPMPGSYLQGRGLVYPGQEFSTPDEKDDPFFERAREMWIPLDGAAKSLIKEAQADAEKLNKQRQQEAAERKKLEEQAGGVPIREFRTREERADGLAEHQRFVGKPPGNDEAAEKRNEAYSKQYRKAAGKDDSSEVADAVQTAVREHIALAGAAAAQPVVDPSQATKVDTKPASKK
jgi:hypothetical protein